MGERLDQRELKLWRSFSYSAMHAMNSLDRSLQKQWQLPLTDFEILATLSEHADNSLRMSDLADKVLVSRSRMTYRVDHLIRRGLVVRNRSSEDGRGVVAQLTSAGTDLLQSAGEHHSDGIRRILIDQVDDTMVEALIGLFDSVSRSAEQLPSSG